MSTRPTISSKLRKPIWAMYPRTCSAMKKKKLMTFAGIQHVHPAHHFVETAEAHLGHVPSHLFGDEEEKVDDVCGHPACPPGPPFRRNCGSPSGPCTLAPVRR